MQVLQGRTIYSASDLNNYLECAHLTALELSVLFDGLSRPEPTPTAALIAEKGIAHEADYLRGLRERGAAVTELPTSSERTLAALEADAAATEAAMARGDATIYQGTFFDGTFVGRSDFLIRVERPCAKWGWSYEVVDAKLALATKPYFMLQLCHYSEHLARVQGAAPENMHVVLGNGRRESFRVVEFEAYYRRLKASFLRDAAARNDSYPLPVEHCGICRWSQRCESRRRTDDHLSLVAGMRGDQRARLERSGIATVAALAADGAVRPEGMREHTFERLREQAGLQLEQRLTGRYIYHLLANPDGKLKSTGFHLLPAPSAGDMFFDMEGDPLYEIGTGLEYLFGCWLPNDAEPFRRFWALTRKEEKAAFEAFIDFLVARRIDFPDLHVYHYAPYEKVAIRKLAQRHGTREDEVDVLLRGEVFVDLYAVVRQALMISQESYSIKKFEPFYGLRRETSVRGGDDSILRFEEWLSEGKQAILDDIEAYNRDDCRSTFMLREWLLERRLEAEQLFGIEVPFRQAKQPGELCHAEVVDGCRSCAQRAAKEREALRTTDAQRRLLEGIDAPQNAAELGKMPEAERGRYLLGNLIAYHRREDKPVWWRFFDRCENADDLIEFDRSCLGGLELRADIEPFKVGPRDKNLAYTYRFPEQIFDLGRDTQVYDPASRDPLGTIAEVDDERNLVVIKLNSSWQSKPGDVTALVPQEHVKADKQDAALLRIGEQYLAGGIAARSALADLLFARPPRLAGGRHGGTVQPADADAAAILAVVERLDASVLFIQGPPGTGKSTKASHVIARLLASGKRVGVMSNSHKAIHNLDEMVEEAAASLERPFRGVHKASEANEGSAYASKRGFIECVMKNSDVDAGDYQFVSGNAWLFASEEMTGRLDYLFIDEAGQIALADAVAVAPCARNLVVIGDPLQLAQVSHGLHPFGVGISVLEHLLGDHHTVPQDRGIFLDVTHRLHPSICTFISEAIYDNRLQSGRGNEHQRIGTEPPYGSGLRYVAIAHDGNSRESREEAERVVEIVADLIGRPLVDQEGIERPATPADLIVVTPYNAQRRLIRSLLAQRNLDVPVGTVDKFQGQQAFAVIYSLATSSQADAPRGLDFLFDKNRFNVAVSRARALSIVVCSDKLVESRAGNIEQIGLLGLFCRYVELAAPPKQPERLYFDTKVMTPDEIADAVIQELFPELL